MKRERQRESKAKWATSQTVCWQASVSGYDGYGRRRAASTRALAVRHEPGKALGPQLGGRQTIQHSSVVATLFYTYIRFNHMLRTKKYSMMGVIVVVFMFSGFLVGVSAPNVSTA